MIGIGVHARHGMRPGVAVYGALNPDTHWLDDLRRRASINGRFRRVNASCGGRRTDPDPMVTSSATTVATHAKLVVAKRRGPEILTTRQRMDLARRPENVTVFMLMIIT
jgi:hypothetical protein